MTSGAKQSEVGRRSVTNSFFQRVLVMDVKESSRLNAQLSGKGGRVKRTFVAL
jgi:hypothetical protein